MNGRERIIATIQARPRDCYAFMPISMSVAALEIGVTYKTYAEDWREQSRGQLAFAEAFGADHVSVISDPCVEASDLGAKIIAPEDQPAAFDESESLLRDKTLLGSLHAPEPGTGKRTANRLAAVVDLARQVGGTHLVEGWVEGPCAESADLRGLSRLMEDFYDDPIFVHELVAFVTEMEISFAQAQIAGGAGIIGVGDAVSSLIGPALFEEFVLAAHGRYVSAIHRAGGFARLHICGNSSPLMRFAKILGYDIIDLDAMVNPEQARHDAGPHQVFSGNLDPVRSLRDGRVDTIRSSLLRCEKGFESDIGGEGQSPWIVGAGCEIPRDTPRANLIVMRDFAKRHSRSS